MKQRLHAAASHAHAHAAVVAGGRTRLAAWTPRQGVTDVARCCSCARVRRCAFPVVQGHQWVGMDISEAMLDVALDREVRDTEP